MSKEVNKKGKTYAEGIKYRS